MSRGIKIGDEVLVRDLDVMGVVRSLGAKRCWLVDITSRYWVGPGSVARPAKQLVRS